VAELSEGLILDLPDPLAADVEFGAHFRARPDPIVTETEAESNNPPFAPGEGVEDGCELLFEESIAGGVKGGEGPRVFDEIAKHVVALLTRRLLERDRLLRGPEDVAETLGGDPHAGLARQRRGDLVDGRLSTELGRQVA
jgi:hypothetical protein